MPTWDELPALHRAAVRRGAELLDRVEPGWRGKIDAETLSPLNFECCVLCQVFGGWAKGVAAVAATLGRPAPMTEDGAKELTQPFGFYPLELPSGFAGLEDGFVAAWAEELGVELDGEE